MIVKFLHDKNKEEEKLLNIYDKYDWFVDNKFPIHLPKFYIKLHQKYSKNKKLFNKDLRTKFDKIYNSNDYLPKIEKVRNSWQKIDKKFFNILNNFDLIIKDEYVCYISLYGPEGQFKIPNVVNLRVQGEKDLINANETIAHELIHLFIYQITNKLKLNYRQTEGLVDLFFVETELRSIFPKYKFQSIGTHNKKLLRELIKIKK